MAARTASILKWPICVDAVPNMKTRFLAPVLAALIAAPMVAQADTVFGVYAGYGVWQQSVTGDLRSGGIAVDVEDDLGVDDDDNTVAYLALEHPLPGLPNVRFQYARNALSGMETLSRSIEINGTTFSATDNVSTDLGLTQADLVLYYELLDSVVSVDLGLVARMIDGDIEIVSANEFSRADFRGALPLLYGAARVDLPLTGLSASAQLQGLSYDGNQLLEYSAQLGYESALGLGGELGWRSFNLEVDDFDDLDRAEIEISGPYLMLNYHF